MDLYTVLLESQLHIQLKILPINFWHEYLDTLFLYMSDWIAE